MFGVEISKPSQTSKKQTYGKGWEQVEAIMTEESDRKPPDVNVYLNLPSSEKLRRLFR